MHERFRIALFFIPFLVLLLGTAAFLNSAVADSTSSSVTVTLSECADGLDNDGDALVDFPTDPDCSSALDDSELTTITTHECDDGIDNDGDGKTDYPDDPGCSALADDSETNPIQIIVPGGGFGVVSSLLGIPDKNAARVTTKVLQLADLNRDGIIDMEDLSIMLFYFDKPRAVASRYDLNNDGKLDILDISVLFYYWA
ncbi:MAG: hypothetical protein AAB495_02745 [Patescibacteria group bacterium]